MTVEAQACNVEYAVTRAATNLRWSLPFATAAPEHVTASLPELGRTLRPGTDFSVQGREVVTHISLPLGTTLRLARSTPLEQPILWVEGQAISTQAIMNACDRLTMMVQELAARVERLENKKER